MSKSSFPDLIVSNLINSRGSWNLPFLISLFTLSCIKEILKIPISHNHSSPFLRTLATNGQFSASSAYKLISNPRITPISSPLDSSHWKSLWKLKLNVRLLLFLWKIAWNVLPTKTRFKPYSIFPSLIPFGLCATLRKTLFLTYFLVAFLLEWLGDPPFGLLIL